MFNPLRGFVNEVPDEELKEGAFNFGVLIGSLGGFAVFMVLVAFWLSHR